ncbi:MAG TPA: TIM barrel protein [Acetobacteraceae bacterium]|jgi:hydroxypyruvate isomerase|nr:TIM barrel protein [Acetobacteraceae bacterium]
MTLSGCIEMLFHAEHEDFAARIHAAHAAGLEAVEFWSWRNKDLDAVERALGDTGVALTGFLVDPRCAIVDPVTHPAFLDAVRAGIAAAQRLHARALIVVTGNELSDRPRAAQHAAIVDALRQAAPLAEDTGVSLVLEPLNTVVNHPGYYLASTDEGFGIVDEVGSPGVRLLYDLYHSVMMGEQPSDVLAGRGEMIGHVHIADAPGRHEPGTGRIDWGHCARVLDTSGYRGPVGLEYRPTRNTAETVAATRTLLSAAA